MSAPFQSTKSRKQSNTKQDQPLNAEQCHVLTENRNLYNQESSHENVEFKRRVVLSGKDKKRQHNYLLNKKSTLNFAMSSKVDGLSSAVNCEFSRDQQQSTGKTKEKGQKESNLSSLDTVELMCKIKNTNMFLPFAKKFNPVLRLKAYNPIKVKEILQVKVKEERRRSLVEQQEAYENASRIRRQSKKRQSLSMHGCMASEKDVHRNIYGRSECRKLEDTERSRSVNRSECLGKTKVRQISNFSFRSYKERFSSEKYVYVDYGRLGDEYSRNESFKRHAVNEEADKKEVSRLMVESVDSSSNRHSELNHSNPESLNERQSHQRSHRVQDGQNESHLSKNMAEKRVQVLSFLDQNIKSGNRRISKQGRDFKPNKQKAHLKS